MRAPPPTRPKPIPGKHGAISKMTPPLAHVNKSSTTAHLPDKDAMNQLLHGDPQQRSIGNYAKLTPIGETSPQTYQSIIDMGAQGASARYVPDPS